MLMMNVINHLVKLENNFEDELFYVFDFSMNEWIESKITNHYPYNLHKFVLSNGKEEINCINSYRISKDLLSVPSNEDMLKLYIAHEKLLKDKIMYSKITNIIYNKNLYFKENDMYCTCNIHIKSDIIPGVIFAFNEYHYYEDTFFEVNVPEETKKKNLKYFEDAYKKLEEENKKRQEIINNFPIIKEFDNKNIGKILDIRPYWKSIEFFPEAITYDVIAKSEKKLALNEEQFNEYFKKNIINKATCGLLLYEDKYKWVFTNQNDKIENNNFVLDSFDGFFDIKIMGGTYARLKYYESEIELEKNNNYFTFSDITKENPLIRPVTEKIHIYSDGEYISYKGIVMDKFIRRTLVSYNEKYILGLFPTRNLILILGNFGYGSTIINLEFK